MFLSRISLDPGANSASVSRVIGDEYRLHQSIWSLFADRPDRQRDFLYRVQSGTGIQVLALSRREPTAVAPWTVQTKPFRPMLHPDETVRFRMRANPVVSRPEAGRKSRRHDVVMNVKAQKRQAAGTNEGPALQQDLVQQAGFAWLARKGPLCGFKVEPHRVACNSYTQHRLSKGGKLIQFSSIDYEGLLTVTDPSTFTNAVAQGIGTAKGFGMGLMVFRRG